DSELDAITGLTLTCLTSFVSAAEAALEGAQVGTAAPRAKDPSEADGDSSLHCAFRRDAFVRIGGFDETLPAAVCLHRALGSAREREGLTVRAVNTVTANRVPAVSLAAFFKRQYELGIASRYSPSHRKLGDRIADALDVPSRAARLVRDKWELTPVLLLLVLGLSARMLGALASLVCGGRQRRAFPSPLLGPTSRRIVAADEADPKPVVSAVVPAYGRPKWVTFCLEALARQDIAEPYEIVVATDAQSGLAAELEASFPYVRTCYCDPAGGPGGARNKGLMAAAGEYVAFTDADCMPEKNWLGAILECCRGRDGAPVSGWTETAYPYAYIARADNLTEHGRTRPRKAGPVPGVSAPNMCVAKRLLMQHEALFAEGVFGAEDVALLSSLPEDSLPAVMTPAAQVRHLRRDGFCGALIHQYQIGTGSGRLRRSLQMRGSFFGRHPWLAPLLVPGRFLLMAARSVRSGPRAALDFMRLSPLILCELASYALGFAVGALSTP
ncbi:MAG: glycosyltransferase family 2 protein, partial [Planctomycetota bacterium]